MGDPIHFMFGSRVGFSQSADRMALFPVTSNPSWRQAAILDNFEWPYLRNGSFDPLIQHASRGHLCDSTAFLFTFIFAVLLPRVRECVRVAMSLLVV